MSKVRHRSFFLEGNQRGVVKIRVPSPSPPGPGPSGKPAVLSRKLSTDPFSSWSGY